jgi:hypothetical protein
MCVRSRRMNRLERCAALAVADTSGRERISDIPRLGRARAVDSQRLRHAEGAKLVRDVTGFEPRFRLEQEAVPPGLGGQRFETAPALSSPLQQRCHLRTLASGQMTFTTLACVAGALATIARSGTSPTGWREIYNPENTRRRLGAQTLAADRFASRLVVDGSVEVVSAVVVEREPWAGAERLRRLRCSLTAASSSRLLCSTRDRAHKDGHGGTEPRSALSSDESRATIGHVRPAAVVAATVAALVAIGLGARALAPVPRATAAPLRIMCGSERWTVKIFDDSDRWKVDLTPRDRTIAQLNKLVKPSPLPPDGWVPAELKTYRVTGTVTLNRDEDDGDVHLALRSAGGAELIAEAPEPGCTGNSRDRDEMNAARLIAQDVPVGAKVVAVGVGFFDFKHL